MNTTQLIKDFGRMLNDNRLGFCDVKHLADGVDIGRIVWADGTGNYKLLVRDLKVTYDEILECVRCVLRVHPTRDTDNTLYSLKYDTRRKVDSLVATTCSNYELHGERHSRMSEQLSKALHAALMRGKLNVKSMHNTRYISDSDRGGIVQFKL